MMKKLFKYFSLLLISTFLMSYFFSKPVSANYDNSKNYVVITTGTINSDGKKLLNLKVDVTYQRGFTAIGSGLGYKICPKIAEDAGLTADTYCDSVFIGFGEFQYISKADSDAADANPVTKSIPLTINTVQMTSSNKDTSYVVFVRTVFCAVRTEGYESCQYWHDSTTDSNKGVTRIDFKVADVLGKNVSDIEDDEIQSVMDKITQIVYDIVMPIIYIILFLFLLIKGTILGVQIVKSADEPQLRQEKIGSLKWLIIGVAIAYAASGLVHVVTGILSKELNFN
jgi:hypothetical protein